MNPIITVGSDGTQNWSQAKKIWILGILSLAGFAGTASALANQLGLFQQAKAYHKDPVEVSYTVGSNNVPSASNW